MAIEREVLVSLLKLTRAGSVSRESLVKDTRIASSTVLKLLKMMQAEDLLCVENETINADSHRRLAIAVKALSLGADSQRISDCLDWKEFERISAFALQQSGYIVKKNMHFKGSGRRWEIDLVGCKKPIVLCIDCKHWHHGLGPSRLKKVAEEQAERTRALSETLPHVSIQLECTRWDRAKFFPAILSLMHYGLKFHEEIPVVPVLQLQDFLNQLPVYASSLKHFSKDFTHIHSEF
jgi:hypothetical protein